MTKTKASEITCVGDVKSELSFDSVVVLWRRLDDGELSDDESTATASDVDNDIPRPASATLLSMSTDKLVTLRQNVRDSRSPPLQSKTSADEDGIALKSDRVADAELATDKSSLKIAAMPTVRLERLSIEVTDKVPSEAAPVVQTPTAEHNYFSTSEPPSDERRKSGSSRLVDDSDDAIDVVDAKPPAPVPTLPLSVATDHCYCVPFLPSDDVLQSPVPAGVGSGVPQRGRKRQLSDVTNVPGSRELSSILPPVAVPPPRPRFQPRDLKSEIMTLLEFILGGVDAEDVLFLRRRYEQLLQIDSLSTDWLNDMHWVDHPTTFFTEPLLQPPPRKRRKHEVLDDRTAQHVTGQSASLYNMGHSRLSVLFFSHP